MAKDQLTAEQAKATQPDSSIWVTASAGTGKTHVLTSRVLRLLITGTPPEKILCLTFTKAAAAEMTNRIFKELGKWVSYDDATLASEISRLTLEKANAETLAYARTLFPLVLDLPGGIKIQTIHSFCQSMLGRFPIEASLTPRFNVMDDRAASELIRSVINQELLEATSGKDKALISAVTQIAQQVTEDGFNALIKDILSERRLFRANLARYNTVENLNAAVANIFGIDPSHSFDELKQSFLSPPEFDKTRAQYFADAWSDGSDKEKKRGATMRSILNTPDMGTRWDDYVSLFLTQKMEPFAKAATVAVIKKHPDMAERFNLEAIRVVNCDARLKLHIAFKNTAHLNYLAAKIVTAYDANKRRLGMLDYDDLIMHSDRLLSEADIAPWILYKLDGGIDHILVDEAQDTNPEQWNLINGLSAEFFVGKSAREETRSVFAVGDAKQSIFGFQRADPKAFYEAKHLVENRAQGAKLSFESVPLNRSFRSTQAILNAVDAVFSEWRAGDSLTPEPEVIQHKAHRENAFGMVEIWPVISHDQENDVGEWSEPIIQKGYQAPDRLLALKIAKRIEKMVCEKEILEARNRPIEPRDIMILVRRRTAFIEHLVQDLKERNIPVAGVDRMNLNDQLAVMDLIALGNFALLPDDDFNTACVLKSPLVGISEQTLFELSYERGTKTIWQKLKERESEFQEIVAFLNEALASADHLTVFEYYASLLNKGARKKLVARLGTDANDPIDEFLNSARQYGLSHANSLQGFLDWVTADETIVKRDLDQAHNEVRIITVHSAKGLEAPIVFLPDTCATKSANNESNVLKIGDKASPFLVWAGKRDNESGPLQDAREQKKLLDEIELRRLLYVAMTRAEDRLYVAGWEGKNKRSDTCWYELISAGIAELPTETIDDPVIGEIIRYQDGQASNDKSEENSVLEPNAEKEVLPTWAQTAPNAEKANSRPLTPSRLSDDAQGDDPLNAQQASKFVRGKIIHRLLELLPDYPAGKRAKITEQYLTGPALRLSAEEQAQIQSHINRLMANDLFLSIVGENSQAEVAITGKVGSILVSAQIDRLVITEDQVHIVDYKTNINPPLDPAEIPKDYVRQLALYQALLRAIYPKHEIICSLLWTENASLMTLPAELLDGVSFN